MNHLGDYLGRLTHTWEFSKITVIPLMMVWTLYPVAVVTVFHPSDAVGFQLWLQGFAVPHSMTTTALNGGEMAALFFLAVLSLVQLVLVTLTYRRSGLKVHFWPLALFLVGGLANACWYFKTGQWDFSGAMAGMSPALAAVVCHGICEKLGADFVFGKGGTQYEGGY
jgi:hypothetical protein